MLASLSGLKSSNHNRNSTQLNIHTTLTAILASGSGVLLKPCDSLQECLSKRFILTPLKLFILIFAFETECLAHMWKGFLFSGTQEMFLELC